MLMNWRKGSNGSKTLPSNVTVQYVPSDGHEGASIDNGSKRSNSQEFRCPGCHGKFVGVQLSQHMKKMRSKCRGFIKKLFTVLPTGSKQCKFCGWKVSKSNPFLSHMKFCSKPDANFSHLCLICNCNFSTSENLKRHTSESHTDQVQQGESILDSTTDTAEEKRMLSALDTFKCLVCEELFQREAFVEHVRSNAGCPPNMFYTFENDKGLIKCKICGWKLSKHSDFLRHLRMTCLVIDQAEGSTECTVCEITLTKSNRSQHYREKHGMVLGEAQSPKVAGAVTGLEMKCRVCCSVLPDASKLRDHKKDCSFEKYFTEETENDFKCKKCDQLKPKGQRSSHIAACWSLGEEVVDNQYHSSGEIRCRTCMEVFTDRRVLYSHKLTCDKEFVSPGSPGDQIQCTLCNSVMLRRSHPTHMKRFHLNVSAVGSVEEIGTGKSASVDIRQCASTVEDGGRQTIHKCAICYKEFDKFHEAVVHRRLCCNSIYSMSPDGEFLCRYCDKTVGLKNKARHLSHSICPRGSEARMALVQAARGELPPSEDSGVLVKLEPEDNNTEENQTNDQDASGVDRWDEPEPESVTDLIDDGEEELLGSAEPANIGEEEGSADGAPALNPEPGCEALDTGLGVLRCPKMENLSPVPDC